MEDAVGPVGQLRDRFQIGDVIFDELEPSRVERTR